MAQRAGANLELRVVLEHEPGMQAALDAVLPLEAVPAHQDPHLGQRLLFFLLHILLCIPIGCILLQAAILPHVTNDRQSVINALSDVGRSMTNERQASNKHTDGEQPSTSMFLKRYYAVQRAARLQLVRYGAVTRKLGKTA